jgi:Protein of unknown function (DUF2817)
MIGAPVITQGCDMTHPAFSRTYDAARAHFRLAASAVKDSRLDSIPYPASGPAEEKLTTDIVWIGPEDATKVFVTVSGTHGVEGFCGSGAQIDWLERGEASRLPGDMAAMLIHAINPYGFAWRRRVTHENVDLNRNWVDFEAVADKNQDYAEIAQFLCPAAWTPESLASAQTSLTAYAVKHGPARYVQTISAGQHTHPDGLFYGGTAPTAARLTLTRILTERLSRAQHVGIIDYHSGLGPSGFGEIISAALADTDAYKRTRAWYGANVKPIGTQGDSFAKIAGDWLTATSALLPHATVTAIALEFGTVGPMEVLEALRADNWLHAHGNPLADYATDIKRKILDAFYTDNGAWQGMVLGQSLLTCRHAIAGLALDPTVDLG